MRLNLAVHTRTWSNSDKLSGTLLSTGILRSYVTQLCQQAGMPTGGYVTPITRQLCNAGMPTGRYVTQLCHDNHTPLSPRIIMLHTFFYKIINIYILLFSLRHASQTPPSFRIQATNLAFAWQNVRMPKKYAATKYAITKKKSTWTLSLTL